MLVFHCICICPSSLPLLAIQKQNQGSLSARWSCLWLVPFSPMIGHSVYCCSSLPLTPHRCSPFASLLCSSLTSPLYFDWEKRAPTSLYAPLAGQIAIVLHWPSHHSNIPRRDRSILRSLDNLWVSALFWALCSSDAVLLRVRSVRLVWRNDFPYALRKRLRRELDNGSSTVQC